MKLQMMSCFCNKDDGSGNPAAVVYEFTGSDGDKQKLASQLNLPVTVFIVDPKSSQPTLEYFYPQKQMPLCLHGTIGAAKVLFDLTGDRQIQLRTRAGIPLQCGLLEDNVQVRVSEESAPGSQWNLNEVENMLGIQKADIAVNLPYTVASVGSPKLLVPLVSSKKITELQPNFEKIIDWSNAHNINGFYVYARTAPESPNTFLARGFNPKTGHNEDAATGVAAAALATCLKRNLVVEQGHCVGKPSRIVVSYVGYDEIWVGGKVVEK